MKLILAIVSSEDANKVQRALVEKRFSATRLSTSGSFLRAGNATFILGVNDEKVLDVVDVLEKHSKKRTTLVPETIVSEFGMFSTLPKSVEVGGAVIFVLPVDQFFKV